MASDLLTILLGLFVTGIIVAGILASECRRLSDSTRWYGAQGGLIALVLLLGASRGWSSYVAAGTALLVRAWLLPWLLWKFADKAAGRTHSTPVEQGGWPVPVAMAGAVALPAAAFLGVTWSGTAWLLGFPAVRVPLALAAGAALLALGLWMLAAHRDTFKAVLGFAIIENGLSLALLELAPELPLTAELGLVAVLALGVWLLLLVAGHAEQSGSGRNTVTMNRLRG